MTRAEAGKLTDTELLVHLDGARLNLTRAWQRGETGRLVDVYDLGVLYGEAAVRGARLSVPTPAGWLMLFDPSGLG
jgi:hypothetical protein